MEGLDVICPGCRKSYHATTGAFNPYARATGAMVRLKDPWRKWGWCSFGDGDDGRSPYQAERSSTKAAQMTCPACCAPLCPSGHLVVTVPPEGLPPREFYEPQPKPPTEHVTQIYTDEELEVEWNKRLLKEKPSNAELSEDERNNQIVTLDKTGVSRMEIAETFDIPVEEIKQIIRRGKNYASAGNA